MTDAWPEERVELNVGDMRRIGSWNSEEGRKPVLLQPGGAWLLPPVHLKVPHDPFLPGPLWIQAEFERLHLTLRVEEERTLTVH
jgi:hypothetical protein